MNFNHFYRVVLKMDQTYNSRYEADFRSSVETSLSRSQKIILRACLEKIKDTFDPVEVEKIIDDDEVVRNTGLEKDDILTTLKRMHQAQEHGTVSRTMLARLAGMQVTDEQRAETERRANADSSKKQRSQ